MTTMAKFVALLLCYVTLSAGGLALLKHGFARRPVGAHDGWWMVVDPCVLSGIACYGTGFLLWLWMLKTHDLSYIFPIAAAALLIATSLAGWMLLGEPMTLRKVLGVGLICAGMAFIIPK